MTKKGKGKKAEKAKAQAEKAAEEEVQLHIEGLDEEMMKLAVEQLKNMVSPCR